MVQIRPMVTIPFFFKGPPNILLLSLIRISPLRLELLTGNGKKKNLKKNQDAHFVLHKMTFSYDLLFVYKVKIYNSFLGCEMMRVNIGREVCAVLIK